jgi:hypothetical protein
MANNANIEKRNVEYYDIYPSDVINYLENEVFGFRVTVDFRVWLAPNPNRSYVRMRLGFNPDDILTKKDAADLTPAEKILLDNGAGNKFRESFVTEIDKFRYPKDIIKVKKDPSLRELYMSRGITEPRLDEIIRGGSDFVWDETQNLFGIYVRAEKVIGEMLKNPNTNKWQLEDGSDASYEIQQVAFPEGDYRKMRHAEDFAWFCALVGDKRRYGGVTNIDLDRVFR